MSNNLRAWLYENVSRNSYLEIYDEAASQLGVSEITKNRDLAAKHSIPYTRKLAWVALIANYNEQVEFEFLFPEVEEPITTNN
jgi:hypothetical protein